jgi:signal transduction histidine kinase
MERLVKDLLRLARLDAGQESLDRTPTDVPALIRGVVDDLAPLIDARRQTVSVDDGDVQAPLWLDAAKLHDIVRNLVENAVNYTPEGGRIEIRSTCDSRMLAIRVDDNGPGIPPEDLTRVFERFYRVDKSRGRPGGTGLGLAIVKHLAELHGGGATAALRPGGGARFEVRLSIAAPPS